MKFSLSTAWVIAALALSSPVFAVVPISSVSKSASNRYVPNEYIVEINDLKSLSGRRSLSSAHEELYSAMRKRGVRFNVKTEFNQPDIIVAASLKLETSDDIAKITAIPGVKSIRPVVRVPAPKPVNVHTVSDPKDSRLPSDTLSTHKMTGVDKLHAEGNFGKGIKIGIIDTGIDYTHPVLGGKYGPGNKIIGGYDFVGDAYTGSNTPVPDDDPLDQCAGHGTHVAGIIGANPDNEFGIVGVASEASIAAYRVFGCEGSTTDEVIVEALLRGYKDGMDILTLSLGGVDGWTEGMGAVVASRIAAKGKVVTIAAGNDGDLGSWYSSSPGNGIDAISVASIDNTIIPVQTANVVGVTHDPIVYLTALPFKVTGDHPIYATSTDTTKTNDACEPLPDSTPDLSDYIVIVHRGTCTFVEKLNNVAAKGAKTILIYNSDTGSFGGIGVGEYTAALISAEDGKFLVGQFAANAAIKLNFPQEGGSYDLPDAHGGLVSSFSTYGPTFDMYFKPAVAAPGGNILSTIPVKLGGFALESGTSMATPFVAGSAALVLHAKGRSADVARSIRTLFQTTASVVPSSATEGDLPQTVSQQGAGLIQVDRAIHTTTIVSPGQLTLNDTAHFQSFQTFSIKNTGKKSVTYQLSHQAAGTAVSIEEGSIFASVGPVPLTSAAATVKFSTSKVTVAAGRTAVVAATFKAPTDVDRLTLPVYSGFIVISSPTESVKVTYLGLAASIKDKVVVDSSDYYFGIPLPVILDSAGEPQYEPTNYTLQGDDVPALLYRLAFGSPKIQVDLVDKNLKLDTTIKSKIAKRTWFSWWWPKNTNGGTFGQVKTLGLLAESDYVPRNSDDEDNAYNVFVVDGTFADGTPIQNGQYRVLFRALKVTGNPKNEADYESWLSPIIGINKP